MSDKKPAVDQRIINTDQATPLTKADKEKDRAAQDYSAVQVTDRQTIQVKVYSPFRDYFDGPAFSVSAKNTTGPFDILPHHHNFISLLPACEVVIRTVQGENQTVLISGGLLHVKSNEVLVFLDI